MSPGFRSIEVGASYRLEATATDADGNVVPDAEFAWTSSDSSVARVDATGLVSGIAAGEATITVTSNGESATAQVSVTAGNGDSGGDGGGGGGGDGGDDDSGGNDDGGGNDDSGDDDGGEQDGGGDDDGDSGGGDGGGDAASLIDECSRPQSAWIWCDDFDQDRLGHYFEYDGRGGRFVRATGVGIDGSGAMRARFDAGDVSAGSLKLAFGRTPSSYFRPVDSGTADYREVYWRIYLRNAPDWTGGGGSKLARAIIFAGSDWSEALIAHLWSGGGGDHYLVIDPASGTDAQGNVRTTQYNDFANLRWLGMQVGKTPIFDATHVGRWYCVEARVRVNDPGQSNGVFELWINGDLEARATNLNWVGSYDAYGINALFLENYWDTGSPRQQERYIDNFVVSTQRVGCGIQNPGS